MNRQHTDGKNCWCKPFLMTIDWYGIEEWRHNDVELSTCECEENGRACRCHRQEDDDV